MAEGRLDEVRGGAAVKGVRGVGMAEPVRRDGILNPGPLRRSADDAPNLDR